MEIKGVGLVLDMLWIVTKENRHSRQLHLQSR